MATPPVPDPGSRPPPPPPAPSPPDQPAAWYPDPWKPTRWRWWDGHQWTGHVHEVQARAGAAPTRSPRLPSYLSVPVIVGAIPVLPLLILAGILVPLSLVLGMVPLVLVVPVLLWMDRVEPEPWSSRLHALLWGAFVAGGISLVANSIVAVATSEAIAAVVSAPLVEETTKALAIVWAVRRNEVDGIMDGLVYAGWVGLGFAVVEDVSYFFIADEEDLLLETFLGRAVLTPFAHPLFTAWSGLAIGLTVRANRPLAGAWWGLGLAIASHAVWNAGLTMTETEGGLIVAAITVLGFVVLFCLTVVGVIVLRSRDRRRFIELLPWLAQRYAIPPDRVTAFADRQRRRSLRRTLDRPGRRAFDRDRATLARLAALFDRPGLPDPADEARLVSLLETSRRTD